MNELTRYCVLIVAVLNELIEKSGLARTDPGLASILKELDALTMVLAHRSRSAVAYDERARGQAALADLDLVREQLADPKRDPLATNVEWENKRWSLEQAIGPFKPTDAPEEIVHRELDLRGVAFLSEPEK